MAKKPTFKHGGARKGAGRPKSDDPRLRKVLCAFTEGEMSLLEQAAEEADQAVSAFCAQSSVDAATALLTKLKR
jgi:peptidyl-tRNA hydrolase